MFMSAKMIFCRFCGVGGAICHGKDARHRTRYKCRDCGRTFTNRTNTAKSGSQFSDDEWRMAVKFFSLRGGMSGADVARYFDANRKTGQRLNRIFRTMAQTLEPKKLSGPSEWDESTALKSQWVVGGVSRTMKQCLMTCVENRSERTLVPLVERSTDTDSPIFTDEWLGYSGLLNRWTVCHAREFVRKEARFVHTNTQEGIWGHLKPMGWHLYRGFPRSTLPSYLSEFMFRYNYRCYETRVSLLSALLSRKTHTLLV
jgi:transposase-like protein